MAVCRNDEMNKGGAYPRSCPSCGFSGTCTRGVKPNPASGIDLKYYIPVATSQVAAAKPLDLTRYAVVIKESYSEAGYDPGDPSETVYYEKFISMHDLETLKNWLLENQALRYGSKEVKRVIKYEELQVKTEVVIDIG